MRCSPWPFGGSSRTIVLAQSGWITGRNIRIETRWTKFDAEDTRKYAAELVALAPDAILATGNSTVGPLLRLTRTVPIVFPLATDPVASGLVESLARPGGNATGFMSFDVSVSAKWLELLKDIAPGLKRAAVLRTLATAVGPGQFGAIQAVAPSLGVELRPIDTGDAEQIEHAVVAFASEPKGGLIAATGGGVLNHRELHVVRASTEREINDAFAILSELKAGGVVIGPDVFFNTRSEQLGELASRHGVPAIYQYRTFALAGGLMSYSGDIAESHRLAGGYTAQILKGEKPADLPVQQATKVELIINLKTAKALGLTIPLPLLGRADEVIE